jgi:hypothetical protein
LKELTQERLKELLDYNPETGEFIWRVGRNSRSQVGMIAGYLDPTSGYLKIGTNGKLYRAHRLAFLWMTGSFPPASVDHINHIPNDNRWCNLRHATTQQNARNKSKARKSSSRYLGVRWDRQMSKWRTQIQVDGTRKFLGLFDCEVDAATVYNFAAHQYYGEFANYNRPLDT